MLSAAIGIFVGVGSRFEKPSENGICHYIEHMVFKGTPTRSAADIASETDAIGGQINAFTSKDCTCFYGRVLSEHLPIAVDILCDMFFNSKFDESDIKNELGVIFEEIDMYEDSPEDLVFDRLFESIYSSSSLGMPVLGKKETLKSFTGEKLHGFMSQNYAACHTVISLCGRFDDKDIEDIAKRFSVLPAGQKLDYKPAEYKQTFVVKHKDIEQNHICLSFPSLPSGSKERFALQLLSNILGGSMSSRLFQSVREKLGLCYSIYTFGATHAEAGLFSIYTALSHETEQAAIAAIIAELQNLKINGITEKELNRAREQVKSNVIMGLESTSALANSYGKSELTLGHILTIDDIIHAYNSVNLNQIHNLAAKILDFNHISFSAVGKVDNADHYREKLLKLCV